MGSSGLTKDVVVRKDCLRVVSLVDEDRGCVVAKGLVGEGLHSLAGNADLVSYNPVDTQN
ncbi:hypothetical protein E1B06_11860 [Brevibacillus laterosporus]|nr:hypothetical protein [Brevibacillus laterosporus]